MSTDSPTADIAPPKRRSLAEVKPLTIGPLTIDPPILQAPMAGFTNYVYRQVVREFGGAGLQANARTSHGVN